ncbi:MAG: hypothetical protein KBC33_02180 [Candidatus Pacebacteria bacterium]|nr:hypothetical protein [Candidatus Paceibacterota bacterium]
MKRSFLKLIALTLLLVTLFAANVSSVNIVRADTASNEGDTASNTSLIKLTNPLKVDSVGGLIQSFVEIFSYIVVLGAVLALIWVGLQFILARGDPKKMNELKGWLFYIIIGVAVVIGARIIIQVVINTLSASGVVDQRVIQSAENALRTP